MIPLNIGRMVSVRRLRGVLCCRGSWLMSGPGPVLSSAIRPCMQKWQVQDTRNWTPSNYVYENQAMFVYFLPCKAMEPTRICTIAGTDIVPIDIDISEPGMSPNPPIFPSHATDITCVKTVTWPHVLYFPVQNLCSTIVLLYHRLSSLSRRRCPQDGLCLERCICHVQTLSNMFTGVWRVVHKFPVSISRQHSPSAFPVIQLSHGNTDFVSTIFNVSGFDW